MKIDRHNYEAFLLDQLEGRLSVEEEQELENFLLLNPDCSRELSEIEPMILEAGEISYPDNKLLKKEFPEPSTVLAEHNFDLFSIARMEGDLDSSQIRAHQLMLEADDQKAQQWQQWQQARLVADAVVYQGKGKLLHKKGSKDRMLWISVVSAAAAIALLFVLFRAEPELPQQEGYSQAPMEELSGQNQDTPPEAEMLVEAMEAEIQETDQIKADPQVQQKKDPVRVSVSYEPVRSIEALSLTEPASIPEEMHEEDIQPLPQALSAQRFNNSSMARGADPDQIKALDIEPVPVHLSSLTIAQISEIGVQEVIEDYAEEKDFSMWKVANAGIKGINKIAGSDISLLASRDEKGEVSGFQLKSKRFSLSRPINREE